MEEVANKKDIELVMDGQKKFIKQKNLEIENIAKNGDISELSNEFMMMKSQ
jgi:hypothetical protein